MKKKSLSILIAVAMTATTLLPAASVFADATTTAPASTYGVEYEGQVQNIGWQTPVTSTGDATDITAAPISGTVQKGLRVEAEKIVGTNLPAGASIEYQAQVQNKGWMTPVTSTGSDITTAAMAGTQNQGLRVEAFKMTLNGLPGYAIKYQTQVQNKGWMDAVQTANGTDVTAAAMAGTQNLGLRMEALKIQIVKTDAEKAAEVTAIDAVTTAETSTTAVDAQAATTAVTAVQDTVENASLTARIAAINTKISVTSVSAISGNQLKVTFTQPVDKATAETAANYVLNGGNSVTSAKLQSDNKTVILNLATSVAGTTSATYGITISGVASAADTTVTIPMYAGLVTVNDTTAPYVDSVTSSTNGTTATSATVTFTKALDGSTPAVKIDGTVVPGAQISSSVDPITGVTIFKLSGLSLDATTTHTLQVINATDSEGNVTALTTKTFSITQDAVTPAVSSVSAYGDHQILVTFSKNMGTANLPAANFSVLDGSYDAVGTVATVKPLDNDTTGTKFVVDFTAPNDLYTATSVTTRNLNLLVKPTVTVVGTTTTVNDSVGNVLAANATNAVTLTKDTTKPTVVGVTVQKTSGVVSSVTVQYSEPVTETGTLGDIQFYNSNGALVTGTTGLGTVSTTDSTKVVYVPNTTSTFTGAYSVAIPASEVADEALTPNSNSAYTGNVDFGTSTATSNWKLDASAIDATTTPGTIQVTFPTAVKGGSAVGSATIPSDYTLNGTALPAGTSITFKDSTQMVAEIVLPTGFVTTDDSAAVFTINNVQRQSDSLPIAAFTDAIQAYGTVAPTLQSAKVIDTNHIILSYNEAMKTVVGIDASADLVLKANNIALTETTLDATNVPGFSKEIEITLPTALTPTQVGQTITVGTVTTPSVLKDASLIGNLEAGSTIVTATEY